MKRLSGVPSFLSGALVSLLALKRLSGVPSFLSGAAVSLLAALSAFFGACAFAVSLVLNDIVQLAQVIDVLNQVG